MYYMAFRKFYTIAIFGNRFVLNQQIAKEKLYNYLKLKLEYSAVRVLVGTHGDFDRMALGVCKQLKNEGFDIHISLVFTSQKALIKQMQMDEGVGYYKDIETMLYDVDNAHYKMKIVKSNQKMVDDSDEVVVYYRGINPNYSGVNRAIKYSCKQNKPLINLFDENDIDKF